MAKSGYRNDVINELGEVGGNIYDLVAAFNDSRLVTYLTAAACKYPLPNDVDFRRRSAMRIGALASKGIKDERVKAEVFAALDGGLTPAQIVEAMIHTAPYVGIPKSLNTLLASKGAFGERGLLPITLLEPDWSTEERLRIGRKKLNDMHREAAPILERNLSDIAPWLFNYIACTAFADVYTRPALMDHQHQLLTLMALVSQGNVENHLETHTKAAVLLEPPLTPKDIAGALVDTLGIIEPELVLKGLTETIRFMEELGVDFRKDPLGWEFS